MNERYHSTENDWLGTHSKQFLHLHIFEKIKLFQLNKYDQCYICKCKIERFLGIDCTHQCHHGASLDPPLYGPLAPALMAESNLMELNSNGSKDPCEQSFYQS